MLEFVDELPGTGRTRMPKAEVEAAFDALYANPGRWGIVEKDVAPGRVSTWRARAERMSENGAGPVFEFAGRGNAEKQSVYGRYVPDTSAI
jgi:hypothetical protein